jgi:histidyl-tRNA synthetase
MNTRALEIVESLRRALPGLRLQSHCGGGKMTNQLKKAFNSGATYALIIESDEQGRLHEVKLRAMGDAPTNEPIAVADLAGKLRQLYPNA